jgi:A/G-specific adenine glycosylase
MELGALVCLPREPRCGECPLADRCVANREGRQAELPERPAKRPPVSLRRTVLLVRRGDRVLLRRRLESELLPGLWDLPGAFSGSEGDRSAGLEEARGLLPFPVETGETLGTLRHAITYRRITLEVREAAPRGADGEADSPGLAGPDGAALAWRRRDEAIAGALSSPARRILRRWG